MKRWFFLIIGLATILFIAGGIRFGSILIKPDESLYMQVSLETYAHHHFFIPWLDGHASFVKPPLVYWMALAAFKIFGLTLWGARLPIWILGLLTVWLTYQIGAKLFSPEIGLRAAVLWFSTVSFLQYSQAAMMDIPLVFFIVFCVYAVLRAHRDHARWLLPCGAAVGLVSLTKGPIGSILAVFSILIYSYVYRCWSLWKTKEALAGILLCFILALAWPVILFEKGYGPAWMHQFIFTENFGKFGGPVMPVKILFIGLLGGMAPWTILFIESLFRTMKQQAFRRERLFFLALGLLLFVVFLFPARKLPHYVLPVLPMACLLIASTEFFSFFSLGLTRVILVVMGVFWMIGIRLTDIGMVQALLMLGGLAALAAAFLLRRARDLTGSALLASFLLMTLPVAAPAIEFRRQNEAVRELSQEKLVSVFCPRDQDPRGFELSLHFLSSETVAQAQTTLRQGGVLIFSEHDQALLPKIPLLIQKRWTVWRDGIGLGQVIRAIWTANPSPLLETMLAAKK